MGLNTHIHPQITILMNFSSHFTSFAFPGTGCCRVPPCPLVHEEKRAGIERGLLTSKVCRISDGLKVRLDLLLEIRKVV